MMGGETPASYSRRSAAGFMSLTPEESVAVHQPIPGIAQVNPLFRAMRAGTERGARSRNPELRGRSWILPLRARFGFGRSWEAIKLEVITQ